MTLPVDEDVVDKFKHPVDAGQSSVGSGTKFVTPEETKPIGAVCIGIGPILS